jgi:hypothetical protein
MTETIATRKSSRTALLRDLIGLHYERAGRADRVKSSEKLGANGGVKQA